jgi:hypothetical protein
MQEQANERMGLVNEIHKNNKLLMDKVKLDGSKRKKRRIKLKAKNQNDASVLEKFST